MEKPAEMVDIIHIVMTNCHLIYFTMHALDIICKLPYPVSRWNLCGNSNQTVFFHFTLFHQFFGFVSCIAAKLEAMRKVATQDKTG